MAGPLEKSSRKWLSHTDSAPPDPRRTGQGPRALRCWGLGMSLGVRFELGLNTLDASRLLEKRMWSVPLYTVSRPGTFLAWDTSQPAGMGLGVWRGPHGIQVGHAEPESDRPKLEAWLHVHMSCVTLSWHGSSSLPSPSAIVVRAPSQG